MSKEHYFEVQLKWTGNLGNGTTNYQTYSRNHWIKVKERPEILSSSAPAFRGDPEKYNPEELLVGSLSSCHMLWYLHICADEGIIVTEYSDNATGTMKLEPGGSGRFIEVTLHPLVVVADAAMISKAEELHKQAHEKCFIANSVNFPVNHNPKTVALPST